MSDSIYKIRAVGGVACTGCGAWEHEESTKPVRHSSRCEHKGDRGSVAFVASLVAAPASAVAPASVSAPARSLVASARRGDLYLGHSDEEIVEAVRSKRISMSDAMNQDF